MPEHDRMFRHEHAHKLDDPERQNWLPIDAVLGQLALRPGMSIADIGAGTGYFTLPIARAVLPGGTVFAVDVQPEMLERLRARLAPGLPVSLVHGDAVRTTLQSASVDLALVANVWHELDDLGATLDEMARILRPGGRVAILDWRADSEPPPGPPLEHRIAAVDVQSTLDARGWRPGAPSHVGLFSYLILATPP
jgi:ubiquinone/menaquinone biosynthesis C-methylase UbiE